ncbi:MAG: CPBP family intramembrane metalloprotease, partial [Actinomycetota bacterium]|nr:CPBP family intramembrane metalloprotease [Actinomycetota bacterium]
WRRSETGRAGRAVVAFFVLAFLLGLIGTVPAGLASRGLMAAFKPYLGVLAVIAAVGPLLAAVVAARIASGPTGPAQLFVALFHERRAARWYAIAVGGQLAIAATAIVFALLFGGPSRLSSSFEWQAVPVLFAGLLLLNVWEEIGFRGFALRELERRRSALNAALIVGVLWGLWHLPLAFTAGNPLAELPFLLFLAEIVGVSVLYTWLYNSTNHSLLFVTLFHVTGNVIGAYVLESNLSLARYVGFRAVVVWVAAVVLVAVYGRQLSTGEVRLSTRYPEARRVPRRNASRAPEGTDP